MHGALSYFDMNVVVFKLWREVDEAREGVWITSFVGGRFVCCFMVFGVLYHAGGGGGMSRYNYISMNYVAIKSLLLASWGKQRRAEHDIMRRSNVLS